MMKMAKIISSSDSRTLVKQNFLAVVATGKNTIITMFSIEGKLHGLESGYGPVGVAEQGSKR